MTRLRRYELDILVQLGHVMATQNQHLLFLEDITNCLSNYGERILTKKMWKARILPQLSQEKMYIP